MLIQLLNQHGRVKKVAEILGVKYGTLSKELARRGISARGSLRIAKMTDDELLRALSECGSINAMTKRFRLKFENLRKEFERRELEEQWPTQSILGKMRDAELLAIIKANNFSLKKTAKALQVHVSTVPYELKSRDLQVQFRNGPLPRVVPESVKDEVVKEYLACKRAVLVGKKFKMAQSRVISIVRERGIRVLVGREVLDEALRSRRAAGAAST